MLKEIKGNIIISYMAQRLWRESIGSAFIIAEKQNYSCVLV